MAGRVRRLYDAAGNPAPGFNTLVLNWLEGSQTIAEHKPPAAFKTLRSGYKKALEELLKKSHPKPPRWVAHKALLSNLTGMMMGLDVSAEIAERLSAERINVAGFRTTLSQGVAKNTGENFTNAIVYALADALAHQDEILVDKGVPPRLKEALVLKRTVGKRELTIPIEADLSIFARRDPKSAIVISAKTRLKEVFHIGTMWKLFRDMIGDQYCLKKWNLRSGPPITGLRYVFATADMIPKEGRGTQGPDVERDEPRNLIAMDASFFDYVFVSKPGKGISHVADSLEVSRGREALFHELGCIFDLVEQQFAKDGLRLEN